MSWKVFVTARVMGEVGQPALDVLQRAGCEVVVAPGLKAMTPSEILATLPGYDATLASVDRYAEEVWASPALAKLKIISRWGVGYDSIDVPAATRNGVVVAYTPELLNEAVADYAFALLAALARRVHEGHHTMRSGEWRYSWGHDIFGKTLGLVGCGRIGRAVARRARGFDMRVRAFDAHPTPESTALGVEFVSFEELLAQSDFVSLHVALTPSTRGLIGESELRQMKRTAYLINTARGPVIQEPALLRALHEGWIAGAALDVFITEPLPSDHPFRSAPNILLTPHQASFARETGERVSQAAAQAIVDLMEGRPPRWVVDPSVFASPNLRAGLSGQLKSGNKMSDR